MILPVLISGGNGSRLWPLSREQYPKQFLALDSSSSMLQLTLARLKGLSVLPPLLVCNESHRFIIAEQLRQSQSDNSGIILEPVGRDTAPAIALAALHALEQGEDPLLLVLATDHIIQDTAAFHAAVTKAEAVAQSGAMLTFGIVPSIAETAYGYIQKGSALDDSNSAIFQVSSFVEKPNKETAEAYLSSGDYLWNSGMFMFKASRYLEELENFSPLIYQACKKASHNTQKDMDFMRINAQSFEDCPSCSIDYAVMENTQSAVVVSLDAGWNDVGSWSSLWEVSAKNNQGNTCMGDVISVDSHNCYIHGQDRLVATLGLQDLVVVDTPDALLVADKNQVQKVKEIISELKSLGRKEHILHREVSRPWGQYDLIGKGERYQVKRITVHPGESLSLQKHHHRAEHWIVVSGTALVVRGQEQFLVSENESTYIPVGEVHSLENPGKIDLQLIEVQSGSYLGEDDIVRIDDKYGRL